MLAHRCNREHVCQFISWHAASNQIMSARLLAIVLLVRCLLTASARSPHVLSAPIDLDALRRQLNSVITSVATGELMPEEQVQQYENLRMAMQSIAQEFPGLSDARLTIDGSIASGSARRHADGDFTLWSDGQVTRAMRVQLVKNFAAELTHNGYRNVTFNIGFKALSGSCVTPDARMRLDFDFVIDHATFGDVVADTRNFTGFPLPASVCQTVALFKAIKRPDEHGPLANTGFSAMKGFLLDALVMNRYLHYLHTFKGASQKLALSKQLDVLELFLQVLDAFPNRDRYDFNPSEHLRQVGKALQHTMEHEWVPDIMFAGLTDKGHYTVASQHGTRIHKQLLNFLDGIYLGAPQDQLCAWFREEVLGVTDDVTDDMEAQDPYRPAARGINDPAMNLSQQLLLEWQATRVGLAAAAA